MPHKGMATLKSAASEANLDSLKKEFDLCTDTFKEVVVVSNNASSSDSTPASTLGRSSGQTRSHSPVTPSKRKIGDTNHVAVRQEGTPGGSVIANGHLDGNEEEEPECPGAPTKPKSVERAPRPREDRDVDKITSESAQGVLPPNACVFVANLLATADDTDLEKAVENAFVDYGECWVKVRRDGRGMPYAFVQYRAVFFSEQAILGGRGRAVLGRPCRTERAKVARALYLSRYTGGEISEEQAKEILQGSGAIEKMWFASQTDKEMFRLPDGIWVEFAYFSDARDAQAEFRKSSMHRLEQPPLPEDLRLRLEQRNSKKAVISMPSFKKAMAHQISHWHAPGFRGFRRTDVWNLQLFVGNLPYGCEAYELKAHFDKCGPVIFAEVNLREGKIHAFVEYEHQAGYHLALIREHWLRGRRLRVEPRNFPRSPVRATNGHVSSVRPRVPTPEAQVAMVPYTGNGHYGQHPAAESGLVHNGFHGPVYLGATQFGHDQYNSQQQQLLPYYVQVVPTHSASRLHHS